MVARLKILAITYLGIVIGYAILDKALLHLTGVVFSTVYSGGVLIVENGVAYHNFWSDWLITYTVVAIVIGTMLSLWQSTQTYSSRFQAFLLSKRLNATSGILLIPCGLGYVMFRVDTPPNSFSNFMAVINAAICLCVIVRWVAKEIYIFNNRKTNQTKQTETR